VDELSNITLDWHNFGWDSIRTCPDSSFPQHYELHCRLLSSIRSVCISGQFTFTFRPRSDFSALGSIVCSSLGTANLSMYRALGTQWATSVLAFASVAMIPIPFAFYRYGPQIRDRSKYAQVL